VTRRDPLCTKADLLAAIAEAGPANIMPTPLMSRGNTSWGVLNRLLDDLVSEGLVTVKRVKHRDPTWQRGSRWRSRPLKYRRRLYGLTEKGYGILHHYIVVKRALGEQPPGPVKEVLQLTTRP
jgi:predicted transcriptional regulator